MNGLAQLQGRLQDFLLQQGPAPVQDIAEQPPVSVALRLGIYAHAYRARLLEALRENFPQLHQLLGDEVFDEMGLAYIADHPSRHFSIRWFGGELAAFLKNYLPFAGLPILVELADWEWSMRAVFDAADAEATDLAAMAATAPGAWPGLRFRAHPSLRQQGTAWNTVAVWRALLDDAEVPGPELLPQPCVWLQWRRDLDSFYRSISDDELAALRVLLEGGTFSDCCEVLGHQHAPAEVVAVAAGLLRDWLSEGILLRV